MADSGVTLGGHDGNEAAQGIADHGIVLRGEAPGLLNKFVRGLINYQTQVTKRQGGESGC